MHIDDIINRALDDLFPNKRPLYMPPRNHTGSTKPTFYKRKARAKSKAQRTARRAQRGR